MEMAKEMARDGNKSGELNQLHHVTIPNALHEFSDE